MTTVAPRAAGRPPSQGSTALGNFIADACKTRNISYATLGRQVDVSRETVGKWTRGVSMPTGHQLRRVAETLALPPIMLFTTAGWLDQDPVTGAVEQRNASATVREQLELRHDARNPEGGAVLVQHALGLAAKGRANWALTVWPCRRGNEFRVHFADYVGLRNLDPSPTAEPPKKRAALDFDKPIHFTGASWEENVNLIRAEKPGEEFMGAEFMVDEDQKPPVLTVPRLLATSYINRPVDHGVPSPLMFLGGHWSGSPDTGALVARALRFGFVHTTAMAAEVFGARVQGKLSAEERDLVRKGLGFDKFLDQTDRNPAPTVPWTHLKRHLREEIASHLGRAEVTRSLLRSAGHYRLCIAYDDLESLPGVLDDLRSQRVPLIVYTKPSVALREYAAVRRVKTGDSPKSHLAAMNRVYEALDRELAKRPRDTILTVPIELPGNVLSKRDHWDSLDPVHDMFDLYAQSSVRVLDWLHEHHGGPSAEMLGNSEDEFCQWAALRMASCKDPAI